MNVSNNITTKEIKKALSLISYSDSDFFDKIFSDENIIASRIHLGIIGEKDSPFQKSGVYSWIEGEIYNLNEIVEMFKYNSKFFSELLVDAHINNQLETVLSKINGCFTAILYDKSEIKLISDRLGMKPLYLWNNEENFVWVSEVKALLALSCFKPEINTQAINCFMDLGHLLGNITWFKDVKLINAASLITYSLKQRKIIEEKRYWKWSSIRPQDISFNEAVVRLGNLLQTAVKKMVKIGEKLGVPLSGGLDSRLNLAAIDEIDDVNVKFFTFGKKGCGDIKIAEVVSSIKNNTHYIFEMNEVNWMDERYQQVWRTDGMISLLYLHKPVSNQHLKGLFDIVIGGNLGECMKGDWIDEFDRKINKKTALDRFGAHFKFTNLDDDFYDIAHQDPYVIDTRGRRFINVGLIGAFSTIEIRRALLDNDLIDFVYALPDIYRKGNKLYEKALLYKYPEYYKNIKWAFTGFPISKEITIHRKIILSIKKLLKNFPIIKSMRKFADYANWLRTPDMVKLTKKILNPKKAIYSNYIDINFIDKYVEPHNNSKTDLINNCFNILRFLIYSMKEYILKLFRSSNKSFMPILNKFAPQYSHDYSQEICRALTMEIWFQQVFNTKYRK